jgi:predicted DNA-binding protein with PD1-like motif
MPENLYPVSQLPHEEWLSENKEFTQQNNIPTAIKRKIGGVRLVFNRYKTTESEEKANTY